MATTMQHMTIEEFAAIDEPGRFDLIRGEVHRIGPGGGIHGEIGSNLIGSLGCSARNHVIGTLYAASTGFVLSRAPDTVLCPDASFVRAERLPPREEQVGFLELAPDLAVEVVDFPDTISGVTLRLMEYLDAGVRLVWLVDPADHTVTVYTPDRRATVYREGDELDGGDVLPGFSIPVAEIFR